MIDLCPEFILLKFIDPPTFTNEASIATIEVTPPEHSTDALRDVDPITPAVINAEVWVILTPVYAVIAVVKVRGWFPPRAYTTESPAPTIWL